MSSPYPAYQETSQRPTSKWESFYRDNERLMLIAAVFLIAVVPYFFINKFNQGRAAVTLMTEFDRQIPFQKGWEFVYMTFQLMCFLPISIVKDMQLLRRMMQAYGMVYGIAYLSFIILPVQMIRTPVPEVHSFLDWGVRVNLAIDAPFNCFPSLHVGIALTSAWTVWMAHRTFGTLAFLNAFGIAISTLTLRQHYVVDVIAGILLAAAAAYLFLLPYKRHSQSALPNRFGLIIPGLYALCIGIAFLAYRAGVPAPPETKWERAAALQPAPTKFGTKTMAIGD